jgi:hypothetical protein
MKPMRPRWGRWGVVLIMGLNLGAPAIALSASDAMPRALACQALASQAIWQHRTITPTGASDVRALAPLRHENPPRLEDNQAPAEPPQSKIPYQRIARMMALLHAHAPYGQSFYLSDIRDATYDELAAHIRELFPEFKNSEDLRDLLGQAQIRVVDLIANQIVQNMTAQALRQLRNDFSSWFGGHPANYDQTHFSTDYVERVLLPYAPEGAALFAAIVAGKRSQDGKLHMNRLFDQLTSPKNLKFIFVGVSAPGAGAGVRNLREPS